MDFQLGHIESPKDNRDFRLGQIQTPVQFPVSYSTDIDIPVLMQGGQPSCVAHATASAMLLTDNKESGEKRDYSPRFLYALAKRDDGIPNEPGTYFRQCFKEAQEYGICDNNLFPNDITLEPETYKSASIISQEAFDNAQPRIIKSYVRIDDMSFDGIKQAIYQNGVVLLGIKVGSEMWTATNGIRSWQEQDILPLRTPVNIVGGHAVLAYGYDENYIYFRNSFSDKWGRGGDGYFSKNYMPFVYEGWTFVDLSEDVVKNLLKQRSLLQRLIALWKELKSIK